MQAVNKNSNKKAKCNAVKDVHLYVDVKKYTARKY